ncbi:MAG: hypothetical protein HYX89_02635, partial [Chloroflexi bacterium]|nr:hypothetical protein [Chloroflexota bacterium]
MAIEREKLLKTRPTAPFSRIQRIRAQDDDTLVEFINGLFVAAMEAKDNGHWEQVQAYLEKWEELLADQRRSWMVFREEKVWAPLAKPLKECRVALITTGGVYIEGEQERFRAEDPEGDWSFRAIPRDTPKAKLAVAHTHYDTSGPRQDINCVFPYERMVELEA